MSDDKVTKIPVNHARPYDGLTREEAIKDMMHDARAHMLAHEMVVLLGYEDLIDFQEKKGKDEAKKVFEKAKMLTGSANDDPFIL